MRTIQAQTGHCLKLFEQWLVASQNGTSVARANNDSFRFNLWVEHNSVNSKEQDSLDFRLRRSTVTLSIILDLLEDLEKAISGM